jgi:hypothetical protein
MSSIRRVSWTARRGALMLLLGAVMSGCGKPAPTSPSSAAATTPSRAAGISLVSSSPAPDSVIVTDASPNNTPPPSITTLNLAFSATYGSALPGATLEAELMDPSGKRCGYWYSDARDMAAGVPLTFQTSGFSWECPVPTTTTSVVVTLLTLTGSSRLTRTEYLTQSFPVGYTYQLYGEPLAAPGSAPSIASLGWHDMVPGCGGDCSAPGDNIYVYCGVTQPDGGSVTTTLSITWAGHAPLTTTTAFPAGATVHPSRSIMWGGQAAGAVSVLETTVPAMVGGVWPTATAVCSTVNSRGEMATGTIKVPR